LSESVYKLKEENVRLANRLREYEEKQKN